jgi:autotransporter passenger strand-loop-strand repeat protein
MQINVTYDSSVTPANFSGGQAEETQFENAVNSVVSLYDALFTNNVTINIVVGWGEADGEAIGTGYQGENVPNTTVYTYSQVQQALVNNAQTSTQEAAYATLPSAASSPFATIQMSTAEAQALGLPLTAAHTGFGTLAIDGYVGFSSSDAWSFNPNSTPANEFDFIGTAEHEISEVMGRFALVDTNTAYTVMDMFRYAAPGVRDLSPSGNTAYFSIDNGTDDLGTWNDNANNGYDLGDWAPNDGPAPGGEDAYGGEYAGTVNRLTMTDVELMNVLGWDTNDFPYDVVSGLTDWVPVGDTFSSVVVLSGGYMEVAGAANISIVSGGEQAIDSGGVASVTTIDGGGLQFVSSGGLAISSTLNSGTQDIDSGGTASNTTLSGSDSTQVVAGTAVSTLIDGGGQEVGGKASATTVSSGGVQYIVSGGTASGTTLDYRGSQTVYGTAKVTLVSGGEEYVYSGGDALSSTVDGGGYQYVSAGGTASDTTLDVTGDQYISSGGKAVGTIDDYYQVVEAGGSATGTIVGSSGEQDDHGTAVSATIGSGCFQFVDAGATASDTTLSGGEQQVSSGAVANRTTVDAGGQQWVGGVLNGSGGSATAATVNLNGDQYIESGGIASGTVVNGVEGVFAGGTTSASTVRSGGAELVSSGGIADNTTVSSGGSLGIETGGLTSDAVVSNGGVEAVFSGGVASATTVDSGGLLEIYSAGSAGSTINSGGTLEVFSGAVKSGTLKQGAIEEVGAGNTFRSYNIGNGITLEVAAAAAASGTNVNSGGLEEIYGTETGAIVSSGGLQIVESTGLAIASTVSSGGALDVLDGGALQGAIANDGTVTFDISGSTNFSGTLSGAGTLVVSGGGSLDVVSAYTGSAQIDDASTLQFTSAYTGAVTFSGPSTGSGGTLKFEGASTGPISVVNPNDAVIAQPGSDDWIDATVNYLLPANVDTLFLYGGTQGTGNSDATGDALYAINASVAQTLTGNSLNDTFVVYNSGDVVVPKAGSHDVVYTAVNYTLPSGVDTLILEGSATTGVGNSDAAGDALYAANPSLPADLIGNSANDTFVVYNSGDVVVPKAGSHDVVYAAANYTLPTGVDVLILEGNATSGTGNSDAAGDALYAANPSVAATLTGNSHNDAFVVYNSADTVIGQAGSTDTVYAAANFTLPTNVDTLLLEGNAAQGTGNGDAVDALYGNAAIASTLVAGSGADTLVVTGGAGTTMTGGAGADTFVFPNAMGHDEITNFGVAKDTLQFNASLFANFAAAMADATQSGANTVFTIDANDSVTVDNVTRSSLTASNFHFV